MKGTYPKIESPFEAVSVCRGRSLGEGETCVPRQTGSPQELSPAGVFLFLDGFEYSGNKIFQKKFKIA